jgi:hypothetical protein
VEGRGWLSELACAPRIGLIFHGLEAQQAMRHRKKLVSMPMEAQKGLLFMCDSRMID